MSIKICDECYDKLVAISDKEYECRGIAVIGNCCFCNCVLKSSGKVLVGNINPKATPYKPKSKGDWEIISGNHWLGYDTHWKCKKCNMTRPIYMEPICLCDGKN